MSAVVVVRMDGLSIRRQVSYLTFNHSFISFVEVFHSLIPIKFKHVEIPATYTIAHPNLIIPFLHTDSEVPPQLPLRISVSLILRDFINGGGGAGGRVGYGSVVLQLHGLQVATPSACSGSLL